jgi:hypothetical protein
LGFTDLLHIVSSALRKTLSKILQVINPLLPGALLGLATPADRSHNGEGHSHGCCCCPAGAASCYHESQQHFLTFVLHLLWKVSVTVMSLHLSLSWLTGLVVDSSRDTELWAAVAQLGTSLLSHLPYLQHLLNHIRNRYLVPVPLGPVGLESRADTTILLLVVACAFTFALSFPLTRAITPAAQGSKGSAGRAVRSAVATSMAGCVLGGLALAYPVSVGAALSHVGTLVARNLWVVGAAGYDLHSLFRQLVMHTSVSTSHVSAPLVSAAELTVAVAELIPVALCLASIILHPLFSMLHQLLHHLDSGLAYRSLDTHSWPLTLHERYSLGGVAGV